MEAMRRLNKDLQKLATNPPPGISVEADGSNLFKWDAVVFGPGDTCFEGGTFRLKLEFPPNYPNKAPTVWFYSKMFHPNVYSDGKVCLDILQFPNKWSSEFDAAVVLCAIQGMLGDPNPDSPANSEANNLFKNNTAEYERRVREIVEMSEREEGDGSNNLNG